jgi:hypothetical protein
MMRLNLAPKPMEGIEEKTLQIMRSRIVPKIFKTYENEKLCSTT